ncbi:MAG: 30S ribosomal protein S20 [Deinococcota bacterium]
MVARNPSAMKYKRQSDKSRTLNRARKSTIRTYTKKALAAAESGNLDEALKHQQTAISLIDKATLRSTLHKNTAARKKSRLIQRVRQLNAQA